MEQLHGHGMGMLAGAPGPSAALPPPPAPPSPTVPMLGPSPGGDLTGKQDTSPRNVLNTTVPQARSWGAAPSQPQPPRAEEPHSLQPSAAQAASCPSAYLHGQAAARKPNTLTPSLDGCRPRVHLCFTQTRQGQALRLRARTSGFGRQHPGAAPASAQTKDQYLWPDLTSTSCKST